MAAGTALLVTPDRASQSYLATALEANGLEVLRAETYDRALEIFLVHRPNGVVVEYPVHVNGGVDLVRELQPYRPAVTKVVAIVPHTAAGALPAIAPHHVDLLLRMPLSAREIAAQAVRLFSANGGVLTTGQGQGHV